MGYLTRALIRRKWESNRRRDAVRLARQPLPTGVEVLEGLPYLSAPWGRRALCPWWWTSTGEAGCTATGS